MCAYHIFKDWIVFRNNAGKSDPSVVTFVRDILEMPDWELVYALKRFILEVRKKNGEEYPAETLYELIVCIQMFLSSCGRYVKYLDDHDFIEVRHCLDNRMKELSCVGKVQPLEKADVITINDENIMWEKGLLGHGIPKQLIDNILYSFGVHFALCAGEHRTYVTVRHSV